MSNIEDDVALLSSPAWTSPSIDWAVAHSIEGGAHHKNAETVVSKDERSTEEARSISEHEGTSELRGEEIETRRSRSVGERAGHGGCAEGDSSEETSTCTLPASVRELFCVPECDAAQYVGLSLTSFKKFCRRHGLKRWPYRKVYLHEPCQERKQV